MNEPMVATIDSVWAVTDDTVAVNTPELFVGPVGDAGVNTLFEPPVAKDTVWPITGLPWASLTVTVRLLTLVPSAVRELGLATNVVFVFEGGPATKVTLAVSW